MRFVIRDPKKPDPDLGTRPGARRRRNTTSSASIQMHLIPDVVFSPAPTRTAEAKTAALLISCAWYTSGKSLIAQKSDQAETASGNLMAWLYVCLLSGV
jgi:hypothetical protein